jgi:hypothetical protein
MKNESYLFSSSGDDVGNSNGDGNDDVGDANGDGDDYNCSGFQLIFWRR